ncbi:hypothetical protein DL93DRAFT_119602 [Clavulina sp. PMI_390]|nr:hypothetical protein DL93DRAFT_119602 [Clavulina sp. PMI_390]
MERLNVIRQVSTDGYKLLSVSRNHALYSDEGGRITLAFNGKTLSFTHNDLSALADKRAGVKVSASLEHVVEDPYNALRDLLLDSLAPLSLKEHDAISERAPHFLSAFTPEASWIPILPVNLTLPTAAALQGASQEEQEHLPEGVAPAAAFLRERYPGTRFEVYLEQPVYELRELLHGSTKDKVLRSTWRAYVGDGAPPVAGPPNPKPMLAYGRLHDTLEISPSGAPRIVKRKFMVDKVLMPTLFKPTMLPLLECVVIILSVHSPHFIC